MKQHHVRVLAESDHRRVQVDENPSAARTQAPPPPNGNKQFLQNFDSAIWRRVPAEGEAVLFLYVLSSVADSSLFLNQTETKLSRLFRVVPRGLCCSSRLPSVHALRRFVLLSFLALFDRHSGSQSGACGHPGGTTAGSGRAAVKWKEDKE